MEYILLFSFLFVAAFIWTLLEERYAYKPIKQVEDEQNTVILYKKVKK